MVCGTIGNMSLRIGGPSGWFWATWNHEFWVVGAAPWEWDPWNNESSVGG